MHHTVSTHATSTGARVSVRKSIPVYREMVATYIRLRGADGATDEEIATALRLNPNTARPRRVELLEFGLIRAATNGMALVRRKTKSGRKATVWVWCG